jgi:hypothetical protein
MAGRPTTAWPSRHLPECGRRRGLSVERVRQRWRLALWCPAAADVRGQARRALVEEDQTGSAPVGVCLIRGQSFLIQRSMASWSRSAARRTGRWTLQPSRSCSSAHTQAGLWRTPVSRSITVATRSTLDSSPVNRWRRAGQQGLLDLGELSVNELGAEPVAPRLRSASGVLGVGRVLVVPRGGGEQLAWPRSCQATATAPTSTHHPRPFRTWNVSTTATVTRADPGRQVHATAPHTARPRAPAR